MSKGMQLAFIAICCALLAWMFKPWAWLFLWIGGSFFVVSLGYFGAGARVFGKDRGVIPISRLVLLWPYFSVTYLLFFLQTFLSREPACNEISPGVWLGRRLKPSELPPGVSVVVDMTAEFAEHSELRHLPGYRCLPTLDGSVPQVEELAALVEQLAAEPGAILIHCALGHGRSAMAVASLLMRRRLAASIGEAEVVIKRSRPGARLSSQQRRTAEAAAIAEEKSG